MKRLLLFVLIGFLASAYCVDSDGFNPDALGIVETDGWVIIDHCVDDVTLSEYSCVDGYATEQQVECDGYCLGGRCEHAASTAQYGEELASESDYLPKSLNDPASQTFLWAVAGLLLIGMLSFYAGRQSA